MYPAYQDYLFERFQDTLDTRMLRKAYGAKCNSAAGIPNKYKTCSRSFSVEFKFEMFNDQDVKFL